MLSDLGAKETRSDGSGEMGEVGDLFVLWCFHSSPYPTPLPPGRAPFSLGTSLSSQGIDPIFIVPAGTCLAALSWG